MVENKNKENENKETKRGSKRRKKMKERGKCGLGACQSRTRKGTKSSIVSTLVGHPK